jgi:hypothetical protein
MKHFATILLSLLVLSACSLVENIDGQAPLTSPCVGLEGSPCGPKRPVNMWLFKDGATPQQFG